MTYGEDEVVSRIGHISRRDLRLWIERGWVRPVRGDAAGPLFDDMDLARLHLIRDLSYEMEVHSESVPVILSLIDQMHGLRNVLRALTEAVEQQPDEVRRSIAAACRRDGRPRDA